MKTLLFIVRTLLLWPVAIAFAASDGAYPLTENSWSNPEFKKRFLGSYGFDMEINPKITAEESELLQQASAFMESEPAAAIDLLESALTSETSAAIDYTIASLLLQLGELDRAIARYEAAIKKFPNFFRAYQNLGLAHVQAADYEAARPMLTKAIEIGGGNGTLYGLLGYCFLNLGRSALALDCYRQALLFQPDSSDWKLGKLNSLLDTGLASEAIGMLSDLIEQEPDAVNFWMLQANAFMGEQEFEKAIANLEIVAQMGEASPQVFALLGDLFLNQGLPAHAVERYENASESSELSPSKLLGMAQGLTLRGYSGEASHLVSKILDARSDDLSPDETLLALNLQASAAIAAGEMERAASLLETIVARDPLNGKALLSLGDYYRESDDIENAMIQYERAAKVEGYESDALVSLARLEIALRQYESALANLRKANALEPRAYLEDYIRRLEAASKSM